MTVSDCHLLHSVGLHDHVISTWQCLQMKHNELLPVKQSTDLWAPLSHSSPIPVHRLWCLGTVQLELGPVHVQFNHVTFISFYILLCTGPRHCIRCCRHVQSHTPVQEKATLWVHPWEKQQKGFKNCAFTIEPFFLWVYLLVRCAECFFSPGWIHRVLFSCTGWYIKALNTISMRSAQG